MTMYIGYLHSTMYLFQLELIRVKSLNAVFTFHYVSISTSYKDDNVYYINDLHSTMYLFQHVNVKILPFILIFTFHYVSISTRNKL